MFDDMELVGKRCHFDSTYKDWDLAWHGTKLISIPSGEPPKPHVKSVLLYLLYTI